MTNSDHEELVKLADHADEAATGHDQSGHVSSVSSVLRECSTALRRLASSDGGVKVRELEWEKGVTELHYRALSVFGDYSVWTYHDAGKWFWQNSRRDYGQVDTLDAAKAAAQADYETRIRSALVEMPAVKGEPVRWEWLREALEEAHGKFCKIAGTENWTDSCLDGWRRSPGALRDYAEQAAKEIDAALTAPGATTKSDGGEVITAEQMDAIENAAIAGQPLSNYGEYTPVTVRGSTRVPTLVDDPNSASGKRVEYQRPPDPSPTYTIAHDGFTGTVQGHYVTREGKEGVVLQQVGTRVVHVYGRKWIDADLPSDPSSTRSERWVCAARQRGITLDPQDCDWPVCGCDPLANKVLDTITESGFVIVPKDGAPMTDDQIKHMVDRFLDWTLPENFNPDGGVSFKRLENRHHHPDASPFYPMPVGSNLFDATEATAMVRHMLEGLPSTRSDVTVESLAVWLFDNLSLDASHEDDARALLDQFEIRRK